MSLALFTEMAQTVAVWGPLMAGLSGYRCIWRTCATTQREECDGDLGHSARNAFQRRHAGGANKDIYRCLFKACERNVCEKKNYRHIFSWCNHWPHLLASTRCTRTLRFWVIAPAACRLMRLTSEPNEEASRNVRYSKQLSKCLFTGAGGTSANGKTLRLESYPFFQQNCPLHAPPWTGRLPSSRPRGFSLWLDCMFWYQQACLGRRRRW